MGATRALLLAAAQNRWLREHATQYAFVKKSVSRFMPGETLNDAIEAAHRLREKGMASAVSHLGENITDANEAEAVVQHYLGVLEKIGRESLETEVSVKLTQLGLDLSPELCERHLRRLLERENSTRTLWIDMEGSAYVARTLEIYQRVLADYPNAGICLQAYLRRTADDMARLLAQKPSIRLVKGAYREPRTVALEAKRQIDANYVSLAQILMTELETGAVRRAVFATHDRRLIQTITDFAAVKGLPRGKIEVQMLYGIQSKEQQRLAQGGWRSSVLIVYGTHWYAWFMRRLAERPANLWFVVRNLAGG
jgi:proline dehydrogenase